MAATFMPDLSRPIDLLRLDLGDTNTSAAAADDETYDAIYAAANNDYATALIRLARAFVALYAQQPDTVEITGALKVSFASRLPAWREIAAREVAAQAGGATGEAPWATAVPVCSVF